MDIKEALSQMDPLDDDQWTQDGAPKVETVASLMNDFSVKRQDIVNAAPAFSRSNPVVEIEETSTDEEEEQTETETPEGEQSQEQPPAPDADQENADAEGEEGETQTSPEAEGEVTVDETLVPEEMLAETNVHQFIAWLQKQPKQNLESIEREINLSADAVGSKAARLREKELELRGLGRIARQAVKAAYPNTSNQDAIKAYIDSQNRDRLERAKRRDEALKHLSSRDVDPRSPLDQAMARKTKRGTKRPERPMMK